MKGDPEHTTRFHQLIGRAMVDSGFRAQLTHQDPSYRVAALQEMGFAASKDELAALERAVQSIDELANEFGGDIKAAT